jgi:Rieske Fe-S protein
MSNTPGLEDAGRRSFLTWIIRASAAIMGLVTVIPGMGMLLSPILAGANRQRRKVILQQPTDAQSPSFVAARFEGQEETAPGIFVRTIDGKVQVVSARCTHAGCAVSWKDDKKEFFCACHNGYFDENGNVKSGPPPRPLERVASEVVNGNLYIVETES